MTVEFKAKGNRGEIWLYDYIGDGLFTEGITDTAFQKQLAALGKVSTIDLHINSDGGDVFQGFAIYNMLAQHPAKIIAHIDGLAASIASVIAMAGDEIRIASNAMVMIHEGESAVRGRASDMRRRAALVEQINENIVDTYASRTGAKKGDIQQWMDDETWFRAGPAVEYGFATAVAESVKVAACYDLSRHRNAPEDFKRLVAAAAQQPLLSMRRQRITDQQQRVAAICRA